MAKCRWCGQGGFFQPVNREGLCKVCAFSVSQDVPRRAQILKESMALVEKTKNPDTLMSRIDVIRDNLDIMLKYEQAGISTITPTPSILKQALESETGKMLERLAEELARNALAKAALSTSDRSAVSTVQKALDKIQGMADKSNSLPELDKVLTQLARFIEKKTAAA